MIERYTLPEMGRVWSDQHKYELWCRVETLVLEAHVEAGDVTLSGRFSGSGRVLVETGSIDARIPPEDARELTFETRVGEISRDEDEESE